MGGDAFHSCTLHAGCWDPSTHDEQYVMQCNKSIVRRNWRRKRGPHDDETDSPLFLIVLAALLGAVIMACGCVSCYLVKLTLNKQNGSQSATTARPQFASGVVTEEQGPAEMVVVGRPVGDGNGEAAPENPDAAKVIDPVVD